MATRKVTGKPEAQRASRGKEELPKTFREFVLKFPELGAAHEKIAHAVDGAGPLDARTSALIKIGICLGAGLESALRSHVRRALEHGASPAELEQAVLLGMNTCGFPRTVAAWQWTWQQIERGT
ncbi:MAG: carboxymuconolactone decarboxylase family protein [Phycisphaerales bacterium]|nr:carboxymuconolactone decarboxylase family protein [Phycisphaerales bacterium]